MKESTKRRISALKTPFTESVARYKGKRITLREAVKVVNEFRAEKRKASAES